MKKLSILLLGVLIFFAFRNWFSFQSITFGDYPFFFQENLWERFTPPLSWTDKYNAPFLSSYPLTFLTSLLAKSGLKFEMVERLIWFWPFLILSFLSSLHFVKKFLKNKTGIVLFFGPFVFMFNSYILIIIGGGQVGIALAYAIAPLVLNSFCGLIEKSNSGSKTLLVRYRLLAGLVLGIQSFFDPRIAFITLFVAVLYFFHSFLISKGFLSGKQLFHFLRSSITVFVPSILLSFGIHLYWLLPVILVRKSVFPGGYDSSNWVEYLSFAKYSDAFSLLHPNWPENIFGKTYFFRTEFLIVPLLAFFSLLLVGRQKKREVTIVSFFVILAVVGSFLAKGSHAPLGKVYLWLFQYLPGINLFRDASKFFLLTALSYAVLIPFTVDRVFRSLKKRHLWLANTFIVFCFFGLFFLVKPVWTDQLRGTFKPNLIPQEYSELKSFLVEQDDFFRTLWLPKRQRFGFYSNNHPAIDSENFFGPNYCLAVICRSAELADENWGQECPVNDRCYVKELAFLLNPQTEELLQKMAVGYLIVPFDPHGEIFIANYKYNPQQRWEVEQFLDQVKWLEKIDVVDSMAVYEVLGFKDHFFIDSQEQISIDWQQINPTKYKVGVSGAEKPFRLVFSEKFDPLWQAKIDGQIIESQKYRDILNSFVINQEGDLDLIIEFKPQKYIYLGGIVSLITITGSIAYLIYLIAFFKYLKPGKKR